MKFTEYVEVNPKTNLKKGEYAPFVEMANVSITYREPEKIEYKKYTSGPKFQNGDSVVARIEPCLQNGKRFFWKSDKIGFGSTEYIVFRAKEGKMDSKYLFYLLKTDYIKKSMVSSMVGATGRQRVNNDIFGQIEIVVPNIEKQKKIGRTLFLYDDLIENNQKQIKLLEEAAQRLYKEWFVDLRFPGHENTKIVDGVPEGWRISSIFDVFDIKYGKILPTSKITKAAQYPVYVASGVIRYYNEKNCDDYATLVTSRGNGSGDVFRTHHKQSYVTNNSFIARRNDKNSFIENEFTFQLFSNTDFKKLCTGSAQPQLTNTSIQKIKILLPNRQLIEKYQRCTIEMSEKQEALYQEQRALTQARNRLLPKLMNGTVEV